MEKNKKPRSSASSKKKKQKPNKKHLNNKVLKAKEIILKNREALKNRSSTPDVPDIPRWKRNLNTIKRIFFWVIIAFLAVVMASFVLIRIQGGTPTVFGYSIQRIASGSMEPTLAVGDIILSKEPTSPDDIKTDDIITFKGGREFQFKNITHRVVVPPMLNNEGEYVLMTKGDANSVVDPEISYSDVQFVMVRKLAFLNNFFSFFLSPWGLLIFIAALLIVFFDELITLAKVLTGNYVYEEEEEETEPSADKLAERLKRDGPDSLSREELDFLITEVSRKKLSKKRNNTSRKKMKQLNGKKSGKKKKNSNNTA